LPACSAAKIDIDGHSRDIDGQVKSLLREAISIFKVDHELLHELAPTIIVTQTQCDVCAVSLPDVEEAVSQLIASRPRLVSLAPRGLVDIWQDIRTVAQALGVAERGEQLVANLRMRLAEVQSRAARMSHRPTVTCIEWIDPLMSAGNWVPELVDIAGGKERCGKPGVHSPWMNWEDLIPADPDMIVIMPCGFDIPRIRRQLGPLLEDPRWSELDAARHGRVYLADGNQYFNRPGPRLVESTEILAEIFHPDEFDFGHRGRGWEQVAISTAP